MYKNYMTVYIKFIALVYAVNCIGYIVTYSAWAYDCIMLHIQQNISLYECLSYTHFIDFI